MKYKTVAVILQVIAGTGLGFLFGWITSFPIRNTAGAFFGYEPEGGLRLAMLSIIFGLILVDLGITTGVYIVGYLFKFKSSFKSVFFGSILGSIPLFILTIATYFAHGAISISITSLSYILVLALVLLAVPLVLIIVIFHKKLTSRQ